MPFVEGGEHSSGLDKDQAAGDDADGRDQAAPFKEHMQSLPDALNVWEQRAKQPAIVVEPLLVSQRLRSSVSA